MLKQNYDILLLLLLPFLIWMIVYFIFGFDGLYGQDAYEYLRFSKGIYNFLLTGENFGDYFWPLYYPLIGAIISLIIKDPAIALLFVSVFSLSITAIYLNRIIQLIYPQNRKFSFIYIIVFFLCSPYVLRYSMVIMSDLLATCFVVLTVYNYYKFKSHRSFISFYAITVFSTLSVMTRYVSFIAVLPFIIASITEFIKLRRYLKYIPLILLSALIILVPHLIVRRSDFGNFLSHQWLQHWSLSNAIRLNFTTVDGTSNNILPNLLYALSNTFNPGYIFLGLPLIVLAFLRRSLNSNFIPILISIAMYAIFLVGIPFQNNRFLLVTFPLVIICFYAPCNYLFEKISKKLLYYGFGLAVCIQLLLTIRAFQPVYERNRLETEISSLLKPYQNNSLYVFDIDIALKGRGLKFDYHNLWEKNYTEYHPGDLVLFHPSRFEKQWKGLNPMINWNYLNSNFKLKPILNCPDGWKLYEIN